MAKKLVDYIGTQVLIRSLVLDEQNPTVVKLLAIDDGGIWIESQTLTEHWLKLLKQKALPKTFVWFVPYAQIAWIGGTEDYPALSEQSLGL